MIDTMAAEAQRRIAESVNRSAGQHLRAMRTHADNYALKQSQAPWILLQQPFPTGCAQPLALTTHRKAEHE